MSDDNQHNGAPAPVSTGRPASPIEEPSAKRQRVEEPAATESAAPQNGTSAANGAAHENGTAEKKVDARDARDKGMAPVKKEWVDGYQNGSFTLR